MRTIHCQLLFLFLLSTGAMVAETPPKADQLLSDARVKAAEQHKAVFVVFGASWCPDCRIFDRFFARPEINAVLDKYFVQVHLNVFEEARGTRERSNPGGDRMMLKFGGVSPEGGLSLPFSAILDEKGVLIVNSNCPTPEKPKGENIGFPAEAEQIEWFMTMIKRGAPSITPEDAHILENRLQRGVSGG